MKRNVLLVPFIAVLTLMIIGFASATLAGNINTDFNGVTLNAASTIASSVGSVVPVRVTFNALDNASDVRVRVYIDGYKNDISASTGRFNIENGKIYTKLLSLKLPSASDDLSEINTLYVEVSSKDDRNEKEYSVSLQRRTFDLKILSVDYPSKVAGNDVIPVSVVVKNTGYNRMDDVYVVASIPALGISARGYVGDLIPVESYNGYDNEEDSMPKTVYLKVPATAKSGIYKLNVKVYNNDAETASTQLISIDNSISTSVLATVKNKELNTGETATYNLVIVNSASDVKVFNIKTISGNALSVSAPSVVTVGPDTSKVIPVKVQASSDAAVGNYAFSVNVNGEQTVFSANVVEASASTSVVAVTVILVIIFVALLIVLVVLLTRKEKPSEEVETSYY